VLFRSRCNQDESRWRGGRRSRGPRQPGEGDGNGAATNRRPSYFLASFSRDRVDEVACGGRSRVAPKGRSGAGAPWGKDCAPKRDAERGRLSRGDAAWIRGVALHPVGAAPRSGGRPFVQDRSGAGTERRRIADDSDVPSMFSRDVVVSIGYRSRCGVLGGADQRRAECCVNRRVPNRDDRRLTENSTGVDGRRVAATCRGVRSHHEDRGNGGATNRRPISVPLPFSRDVGCGER
jgi:hypothetical protein